MTNSNHTSRKKLMKKMGTTVTIVTLDTGMIPTSIYDDTVSRQVTQSANASAAAAQVRKRIYMPDSTKPLTAVIARARKTHKSLTIPWNNDGARILPARLITRYRNEMDQHMAEMHDARLTFVRQHQRHVQDAQQELGTLFDASLYRSYTVGNIDESIFITYTINAFPNPEHLAIDVAADVLEDIKGTAEKNIEEQVARSANALKDRVVKLIEDTAENSKATPPPESPESFGTPCCAT